MFCWYLRNTYLENRLKSGELVVAGETVDLTSIDAPAFVYGSREDHIVPWPSAYDSLAILSGPTRFVLGASGHIAGVINSPANNTRNYWTNDSGKADSADAWFQGAAEHAGSWWPEWSAFLNQNGGKKVKAKAKPGNAKYKPIEPAPGRYVKVKAD
jgi:polyhydroxyalkanoate synthase